MRIANLQVPQFSIEIKLDVTVAETNGDLIELRVPITTEYAHARI